MKRSTILILSAVLIAAMVSGCVQETSEIGTPGGAPQSNIAPPAATPDAAQPAHASEVTPSYMSIAAPPLIANWKYVSYRNLSISNAPALNQTARITYSIIPDRDIEDLLVCVSIPDGFKFVDVEGERLLTWGKNKTPYRNLERCARWGPTNLSKDTMYQFSATIKAVKTGNWTIARDEHTNAIYLSVSEDSAYISDEPFPKILVGTSSVLTKSEFEKIRANMTTPDTTRTLVPGPSDEPPIPRQEPFPFGYWWNGTARIMVESMPKNMTSPYWNGTAWVEGINQS